MKQFRRVRINKPKSSVFNLSHEIKLTTNMGDLTPIICKEIIPGDRFNVDIETLLRFQPLIAPIMHRINLYIHFFYVPNRIIWNEWEDFITGGREGNLNLNLPKLLGTFDQFKIDNGVGSLADYLGMPVDRIHEETTTNQLPGVSQLPFRAYQEIYNQYYRDQNLEAEIDYSKGSANSTWISENGEKIKTLRKRAWEKDYFTSALPWAQRGDDVTIPLTGDAEVKGRAQVMNLTDPNAKVPANNADVRSDAGGMLVGNEGGSDFPAEFHEMYADLSEANATTIRDLRTSYAVQRWLEKSARTGSRYIEQILAHFGIKSSDARLQRPEYLGGGRIPVQISEVLSTAETEGAPQANMAGHGISSGRTAGFKRFFEEHGHVMGILSVIPRTAYQQGIHRMFTRESRFDYAFPEFAHIGEQEIKNKELYVDTESSNNEGTFGYQERYAEYRTAFDRVAGEMRTNLDFWHAGRKFATAPSLSNEFVKADTEDIETRIFPVGDPQFKKVIIQAYAKIHARRPLPKFGTPMP